jgi:hypothetical protein
MERWEEAKKVLTSAYLVLSGAGFAITTLYFMGRLT